MVFEHIIHHYERHQEQQELKPAYENENTVAIFIPADKQTFLLSHGTCYRLIKPMETNFSYTQPDLIIAKRSDCGIDGDN